MIPLDTAPDIAVLQEQVYRDLGITGRFRIALELSDLTHSFATAGIRSRNPQFSDEDARRHLADVLYGCAAVCGE